ncbi:hypothetical protein EPN95_02510 [Patescibacteria group bacterium]|nr:MAG: hypothetical protein EPN95_02510 [Patescibacteria group bacterium]
MKKAITIICVIGSLLLILDSMDAANSLLLFLFAGVIPGTNILISPIEMMAATATAITVVILRLTVWPIIRTSLFTEPVKTSVRAKRTTHRAV